MLKLNAVFNTVWGRLVFFVFISLHINLSHICMVKVLAVIYNPKPDNEHPHCLSYGRSLRRHSSSRILFTHIIIIIRPLPVRLVGMLWTITLFHHYRSYTAFARSSLSIPESLTGASRGCPIVFSLFLEKPLPPSTAFTQSGFHCHTKIKYWLLTCFPFPFLIQKAVTPINCRFCRLANKSIWPFIAL